MEKLELLNKKRVKEIDLMIRERWDSDVSLTGYAVYINRKNRLFLVTKDIIRVDVSKLRINSLGTYFGEILGKEIRLSIEGSQLIGMTARKNLISLDDFDAENWMQGLDLDVEDERVGFVIVKHGNDILGCGKLSGSRLYNYVPKERRTLVS